MSADPPERARFQKAFLLVLVFAVSAAFVAMIWRFLMQLLLAAIFSGVIHPIYRRVLKRLKGRRGVASFLTVSLALIVVGLPLIAVLSLVAAQAFKVTESVRPWVEEQIRQQSGLEQLIADYVPFAEQIEPYHDQVLDKAGQAAGHLGSFLSSSLSAVGKGTVRFFFNLFVMLYAMFFFLVHGREVLDRILYYMPLAPAEENRLVDRFVSVTRATLKGSLIIGVLQGALAGLAFAVAGIEGAAFWGTVMAVLSIIPGVGIALIWVPAVIYLLATGHVAAGIGVGIWCGGVAGTVDNVLKPRLVGKDAELPTLMMFLGTLGGIVFYGAAGIVIGPILASLFVTVWEIYGAAFRDLLPSTASPGGAKGRS